MVDVKVGWKVAGQRRGGRGSGMEVLGVRWRRGGGVEVRGNMETMYPNLPQSFSTICSHEENLILRC